MRYDSHMDARTALCLEWFIAYCRTHADRADPGIRPLVRNKVVHTMRVLFHVRNIVREARFEPQLALAAEIAAILHDTGRFPQLVDRRTFNDRRGYDHAEEGVRILAGADILDGLEPRLRAMVLEAVRLHNRAVLPVDMDRDVRAVTEALRDADKLDVLRKTLDNSLRGVLTGKAADYGIAMHETEVSPEVVRLTLERRLIPFESIRWSNDFVLFLCAWLHDLHHPYAYRHLIRTGLFERLLAQLPDQGVFPELKARFRADLAGLAGRG